MLLHETSKLAFFILSLVVPRLNRGIIAKSWLFHSLFEHSNQGNNYCPILRMRIRNIRLNALATSGVRSIRFITNGMPVISSDSYDMSFFCGGSILLSLTISRVRNRRNTHSSTISCTMIPSHSITIPGQSIIPSEAFRYVLPI